MDFIAAILELGGKWVVGHKNRYGWLASIGANLCWILYVLMSRSCWGSLLLAVPAIFINIRNFRKWK